MENANVAAPADLHVDAAIEMARRWLVEARAAETRRERAVGARLHELVAEPDGVEFAMRYVDRIARHRDDHLAADQLAALVSRHALPSFLGPIDRLALRVGGWLAPRAPRLVMPLARLRLRQLVGHLVVDAVPASLERHAAAKRAEGVALNINLLGEAVLGDGEAADRFERTLALIADPDVTYVSVKASAIASQIDLWAFDDSLRRVKDRLRGLYSAAAATSPPTFVNLDMEEYKDLELTIRAFTEVLDEPAFAELDAGIVLQAYLPEALASLQRLTAWATTRHTRTGGQIKVRLVKGANLAMERVDAAIHNWQQAPFATKADVDANYKRCLDWVLTAEHTVAVRIGVASHNLFDVAWAKLLVDDRNVADRVDFEMLQGMAPAQSRVVHETTGEMLLYTPIVAPSDFDVAISYLIRRLEENASGDNFLAHLFALEPDSAEFAAQADGFRASVSDRLDGSPSSRRRGVHPRIDDGFTNHPDTDPARIETQGWIAAVRTLDLEASDNSVCRTEVTTDVATIDAALARARSGGAAWGARSASERRELLWRVADELDKRRDVLLATMQFEARKTFAQADVEITEAIDFARWYGDRALELEELSADLGAGPSGELVPHGVVVVVPPWNFPVAIASGGAFAALAAGNAVILKPAPETPRCAEIVVEAAHAAGIPADALQFVRTPDDEVGQALVVGADAVILTGSTETAELFQSWRPDLRLLAETSGKNALIITPHADVDLAVEDLVASAFGHAGQKCSAASLAILVGEIADDDRFHRQLVDAVESLEVDWPQNPAAEVVPTIGPVEGKLERALNTLEPGERWLVEPRSLDDSGALWSPGVRIGVTPGSWFHRTECFGPVLGIMRARTLDEAIDVANASSFGLTGGIHSLDEDEIDRWLAAVEVGNAYVNRAITGAIVQRQPFGGWKASSVGLGAKAGGPDYLLQLVRRTAGAAIEGGSTWLATAAESDAHWWATHYGVDHDPSGLFCESNVLRYRPHPDLIIRASADADLDAVWRALAAADVVGCRPTVSIDGSVSLDGSGHAAAQDWGRDVAVETDAEFAARLEGHRWARVRAVGEVPLVVLRAAAGHAIAIVDEPVTASGRLELRLYLREQAISRTMHRFGNVAAGTKPAA